MKRTKNQILVDAYHHLIDVSLNDDLYANRSKVKAYILEDKSWKRLFKALSYNTFSFLEDPFGYKDESTFKDEDFKLLYALGIIDEGTMEIDHDFDQAIINCENKDKIIPYLKIQTGIKGLIDLYGYIDDETLFKKAQYAFDSELFEIELLEKVDESMFKETTAPLIAAYAYQQDKHFIRIELKEHLDEFIKAQKEQAKDLDYADFSNEEILYFSSSFNLLDSDYKLEPELSIINYFNNRYFSIYLTIDESEINCELNSIIDVNLFTYNYPKWIYKGHSPADYNSYKLMKEF